MTKVIFVHGINTRGAAYDIAFGQVRSALTARRPDINLIPCRWGDDLGATLKANGASIPRYDQTRAIGKLGIEELDENELWELLDQDPLLELRLLALRPVPPLEEFDPRGSETPTQEIKRRIEELTQPEKLEPILGGSGLGGEELARVCQAVMDSPSFSDALTAAADDLESFPRIWARAVVGSAMADHPDAPISSDAQVRDAVVDDLVQRIASQTQPRGMVGDWLIHALSVFGTRHVQIRRGHYSDLIVPVVGDVLVYQGHGELIRRRIRAILPEESPVVLLAHSLGGVACVDLLIEAKLSQVELLLTVGSQAPFFYELDALQFLRFGQPLPSHFPRWLNLYDPRDFLSYIAARVFPSSQKGVVDVQVDNRQPFVKSHSAYWPNPQTWDAIVPELP